jgi:hypothetical protein
LLCNDPGTGVCCVAAGWPAAGLRDLTLLPACVEEKQAASSEHGASEKDLRRVSVLRAVPTCMLTGRTQLRMANESSRAATYIALAVNAAATRAFQYTYETCRYTANPSPSASESLSHQHSASSSSACPRRTGATIGVGRCCRRYSSQPRTCTDRLVRCTPGGQRSVMLFVHVAVRNLSGPSWKPAHASQTHLYHAGLAATALLHAQNSAVVAQSKYRGFSIRASQLSLMRRPGR